MPTSGIRKAEKWRSELKVPFKTLRIIRIISLVIIISVYVVNVIDDGVDFFLYQIKYMTYWGSLATLIYFIVVCFMDLKKGVWTGPRAKFNLVLLGMNMTITIFYFGFLYESSATFNLTEYSLISKHLYPLILTYLEFTLNNTIVYYVDIWVLVVIVLAYVPVNLIFTFVDEPVYSLITYKDVTSYIYLVALLVLFIITQIIGILYQWAIKRCTLKWTRLYEDADLNNHHGATENKDEIEMNDIEAQRLESNKMVDK